MNGHLEIKYFGLEGESSGNCYGLDCLFLPWEIFRKSKSMGRLIDDIVSKYTQPTK